MNVTDRRNQTDWAEVVQKLADEDYAGEGGDGQSEHASSVIDIRDLFGAKGPAHRGAAGDTLNAKAWYLDEHD